jgi:hypothetical protein
MGHKLSGFFSVKGSKQMEMIYCNFNPNKNGRRRPIIGPKCFYLKGDLSSSSLIFLTDTEKWIGYADVKSAPVHFYAKRSTNFITTGTPIRFDFAQVNEGNAMDLNTGKFTAPRPGIYFFSFTGLASFPDSSFRVNLEVTLYLNGGGIGRGWVEEANTVAGQRSPLLVHSTLKLKKGDQVWVAINLMSSGVNLYDSTSHHTHFTGWMLEEEIVASL